MEEQKIKQTKNQSINFLKAIACICVVLIHARFPGWCGEIIAALSRSAVALFFVVAGYYSFNADKEMAQKKCIKKIVDTVKLCVFVILFYLAWGIFVRWVGTGLSSVKEWLISLCSWDSISSLIFFQEDIFAGHLWFIYALLVCYIVNLVVNKLNLYNVFSIICVLLIAFMLIITNILPNFGIELDIPTRNAWFYGIPMFMFANRLHWLIDNGKIRTMKKLYMNLIIAFLCCLILVERYFCGYSQLYLGNIFLVFAVFILAIQYPDYLSWKPMCFLGEHCSTNIYIFHWAIINVVQKVASMAGIIDTALYDWGYPIVTLVGSIIFSIVLYYVIKFINQKVSERKQTKTE